MAAWPKGLDCRATLDDNCTGATSDHIRLPLNAVVATVFWKEGIPMIAPAFQRMSLGDGRVVILKTEIVCEISTRDEARYRVCATDFKEMRVGIILDGESPKKIIAGILKSFNAQEFSRDDVMTWCAFAEIAYDGETVSSALHQLHTANAIHPIPNSGRKDRWRVASECPLAR